MLAAVKCCKTLMTSFHLKWNQKLISYMKEANCINSLLIKMTRKFTKNIQVIGQGLTSAGRENGTDCWKGHDPELRTWIEKSTEDR